jgi:SAM-dependent methyltransferase
MDQAVYERMKAIDGHHWWFVARRQIVDALMVSHMMRGRPLRILEVGCGTGSNIALLERYGQVDALEPDDGARAFAAERTGKTIHGGFLPDGVELEDGAYDAIVLLDVLEHIAEDSQTLSLLRRKLAPGGRLLVTVPAMPWLWSAHDVAHHHHRRYTTKGLTAVMQGAGFHVRHSSHFNSLLFPLIVTARALGKLFHREGGDDAVPAGPVNAVLRAVFASERHWVSRAAVPWGVSLAMVAEPA